uniref:Uncharacterized protein n=1 Tax=Arundo donax TaxID=35708 RepID=A0A0A9BY43_ARUDO
MLNHFLLRVHTPAQASCSGVPSSLGCLVTSISLWCQE